MTDGCWSLSGYDLITPEIVNHVPPLIKAKRTVADALGNSAWLKDGHEGATEYFGEVLSISSLSQIWRTPGLGRWRPMLSFLPSRRIRLISMGLLVVGWMGSSGVPKRLSSANCTYGWCPAGPLCIMCNSALEDHYHLFFGQHYLEYYPALG